ncbi:MAG: Ser-Thr-rich GPI-anchored membrane family protein [Dehalococcoidia bacterium]|nr:Ser-Thr-rich GPI-anchored membrane family protein [Dehalococcoidia bacterium]
MSLFNKYFKTTNFLSLVLMFSIIYLSGCSFSGNSIINKNSGVINKDLDIKVVGDEFLKGLDPNMKDYLYFTVFVRPNKNTVPNSKYNVDVIYKETNTICSSFTINFGEIPTNLDKSDYYGYNAYINKNSQPIRDYNDNMALPVKDRKNITPQNMFDFKTTNQTINSEINSPVTVIAPVSVIPKTADKVSLAITYPKGGENFHAGDVITITWKSTNLSSDKLVVIASQNSSGAGSYITGLDGVPNTGSYEWTIPTWRAGTQRKIVISIDDNNHYLIARADSGYFTIIE